MKKNWLLTLFILGSCLQAHASAQPKSVSTKTVPAQSFFQKHKKIIAVIAAAELATIVYMVWHYKSYISPISKEIHDLEERLIGYRQTASNLDSDLNLLHIKSDLKKAIKAGALKIKREFFRTLYNNLLQPNLLP